MSTRGQLEFTAVQRRRELAQKYFPKGMTGMEVQLLADVEQLLLKAYEAGTAESGGQAWSNQAVLGYTIMAAEQIALPASQIRLLVRAMHSRFDFKTTGEAAAHYRQADY